MGCNPIPPSPSIALPTTHPGSGYFQKTTHRRQVLTKKKLFKITTWPTLFITGLFLNSLKLFQDKSKHKKLKQTNQSRSLGTTLDKPSILFLSEDRNVLKYITHVQRAVFSDVSVAIVVTVSFKCRTNLWLHITCHVIFPSQRRRLRDKSSISY